MQEFPNKVIQWIFSTKFVSKCHFSNIDHFQRKAF